MRYQSPIASPLAHYWEEELVGFWGQWAGIKIRIQKLFSYLVGDILFANIYLLFESVQGLSAITAGRTYMRRIMGLVNFIDCFKRGIDILGSIFGIIICLPIWIVVPILIKLESKGPVFYKQVRVGRDKRKTDRRQVNIDDIERRYYRDRRKVSGFGKPFRIIKFRTMYQDAEKLSGPKWASKDDPRITRLGRMLRKTRIDEIPQLFNVLAGNMSLVGPRPERPFFVAKLDGVVNNYVGRFKVKPGITGLAQVEHKYDESIKDVDGKIKYDLKYIKNIGILQDIRILLKTVIVVVSARGM